MNEKKIAGLSGEELFASGHRACAGCGEALTLRHTLKAAGRNTIVVMATGCMEVVSTPYPESSWEVPWIHGAFENAPAIASGIDKALRIKGTRDRINLLCIGGDGASFDIGFGALSGAIERGQKFTYIANDNEAYMNTGIQRSGATFPFAATTTSPAGKKIHGKPEPKKPLPLIVAAHGVSYVATASIANPIDLAKKVQKSFTLNGVSFLQTFCPCVPGWRMDSSQTMAVTRKAIETGVFPVYEIENGTLKFSQKVEQRKPVIEYLRIQGRFKHLGEDEVKKVQAYVDARYEFLLSIEGRKCFDVLF